MTRLLTFAAVLALVAGALAATWLLDWRWLVTGVGAFVVLGLAGTSFEGRGV